MNNVQLIGRMVADPDIKYTNGGATIGRFRIAVDRRYKKDGEQEADFISCVTFGKTAEFLEKYFHKGMRIGLTGRIQTGSYDNKDGQKVYTTDVVAENVEFVESKKSDDQTGGGTTGGADFMQIPDGIDEQLPFN